MVSLRQISVDRDRVFSVINKICTPSITPINMVVTVYSDHCLYIWTIARVPALDNLARLTVIKEMDTKRTELIIREFSKSHTQYRNPREQFQDNQSIDLSSGLRNRCHSASVVQLAWY